MCCAKNRSVRILLYAIAKSRSLSHTAAVANACVCTRRPNGLVRSLRYAFNANNFDEFTIKLSLLFVFNRFFSPPWRTHGFQCKFQRLIYRDAVNWQLMILVVFFFFVSAVGSEMNALSKQIHREDDKLHSRGKYDSFSMWWWDIESDYVEQQTILLWFIMTTIQASRTRKL